MNNIPFPPSNHNLNFIITQKYLNYKNGIFVEAGAANGLEQSNTWNLETFKDWHGILVEPNLDAYNTCKNIRPNSKVYNCALVDKDYKKDTIEVLKRVVFDGDPGLMSSVAQSDLNDKGLWFEATPQENFYISARTLDSILEENNIKYIDFLSLDVEGYEYNVLKGFTVSKYLPKVISIECHLQIDEINNYLSETHSLVEKIGEFDYVYILKYFPYGLTRDTNK